MRESNIAQLLYNFRTLDDELVSQFNKETERMGVDYDDRIRFLENRVLILGNMVDQLMEVLSEEH